MAYDSLAYWNVGAYDPIADFSYSANGFEVSFVNESDSASSFQWNFGNGVSSFATDTLIDFGMSGTFTVQLIAQHCDYSDTAEMIISLSDLGIDEIGEPLQIYPNPANEHVWIESSTNGNAEIYNSSGELIVRQRISPGENRLSLFGLNAGVYLIRFQGKSAFLIKQ